MDPYNASPKVFSQITESTSDAHVAAYINRVLKSVYEYDENASITKNLQSHSTRRGGAAFASSNASVNLSDLAHRGLWSMDGFATLLEYISPTAASDQNVAKVLGGWTDTKNAGVPPSLICFEAETYEMHHRVHLFAAKLRELHFAKIKKKGFADCLIATVLMYYRDTMEVMPSHSLHSEIQRVYESVEPRRSVQEDLLHWGSIIRRRFVSDNILALPVDVVRKTLTTQEQADQFIGIHTFTETLQRLLVGYQHVIAKQEELRYMMHTILDRMDRIPALPTQEEPSRHHVATRAFDQNCSNEQAPSQSVSWPSNLKKLAGKRLSDFLVQYVVDGLASVPHCSSNRAQKDCARAVQIVGEIADLSTIPLCSEDASEKDRKVWLESLQRMAVRCEQMLVEAFSNVYPSEGSKRKRRRTGNLTGIVKAWGELSSEQRAAFRRLQPIRFGETRSDDFASQ